MRGLPIASWMSDIISLIQRMNRMTKPFEPIAYRALRPVYKRWKRRAIMRLANLSAAYSSNARTNSTPECDLELCGR